MVVHSQKHHHHIANNLERPYSIRDILSKLIFTIMPKLLKYIPAYKVNQFICLLCPWKSIMFFKKSWIAKIELTSLNRNKLFRYLIFQCFAYYVSKNGCARLLHIHFEVLLEKYERKWNIFSSILKFKCYIKVIIMQAASNIMFR